MPMGFRLSGRPAAKLLALLAAIVAWPSTTVHAADELEKVIRVWGERERATRSLHFVVSQDHLMGRRAVVGPDGGLEPADDVKTHQHLILSIDGERMRYERRGDVWMATLGARVPQTMLAAFDGKIEKELRQYDRNDDLLHSRAYIRIEKQHGSTHNLYLSPIIRHYRPVSKAFTVIKLDRLKVVDTDASFNSLRCILLEEPEPGGVRIGKYWVCPEQDMAIIRYVGSFKGEVEWQAEASFRRDPKVGWVPERWKATQFGDDKSIISSAQNVVTDYKLNIDFPDAAFDVVFPAGTEVFDYSTRKQWIVKPDGSQREILPEERRRGVKYSELWKSAMGDGVEKR